MVVQAIKVAIRGAFRGGDLSTRTREEISRHTSYSVDDILENGENDPEHLTNVEVVLRVMKSNGLK